jgi:hypothetical protein
MNLVNSEEAFFMALKIEIELQKDNSGRDKQSKQKSRHTQL